MNKYNIIDNILLTISKTKKYRDLNIFTRETFDLALIQAKEAEKRKVNKSPKSSIDGLTFTIKDNFCTKLIPTTCGSKMLEKFLPQNNATVIDRLYDSGAILIGKTNLDEFGMGSATSSFFGTTKNPLPVYLKNQNNINENDFYICGGSSGGSAASVSAGLVDFSIGSDTGGSIRNPASICGCIGFKPTYGLISRYGLIPLNDYFDTVGIFSNSIETIVNVLNNIAGEDFKDVTTIKGKSEYKLLNNFPIKNIKIGVPKEFYPNGLSQNNLKAWIRAINVFNNEGLCKISTISLPNVPYTMSCYSVSTSCKVASNFSRFDGLKYGYTSNKSKNESLETTLKNNRSESIGKVVKSRIVTGNYFLLKDNYEKYFLKSLKIKENICQDFIKVFNDLTNKVDVIITPTCFHDTFRYSEYLKQEQVFDEKDFFTACANIAGLPAITIPTSLATNDHLPIGIQLISNWKNENLLLNIADWFMKNNRIEVI